MCKILKSLICLTLILYSSILFAQNQVIKNIRNLTVGITVETPMGGANGSGILFSCNNQTYVLTAGHVVSVARIIGFKRTKTESQQLVAYAPIFIEQIVDSGKTKKLRKFPATIVRNGLIHDNLDVAVLMLIDVDQENNLSFDFNEPDIGTNTLGCGQLLDSELLTTDGIVSEIYTTTDYGFHHQATNNVQGGFSGGGIFNADNGKCIGINWF